MEDSQTNSSQAFEQLWNMADMYATDFDGNTLQVVETESNDVFSERQIEFHIDQLQFPPLGQLPDYPPQNYHHPSVDSGAPPSDLMSEMTTSPGAVSAPSPAPPQNGAASQVLPSNTVWPGDYSLEFTLETCGEHAEKSISWTYSPTLQKLYVDREKNCPINFKTSRQPPAGSILRVMPIFQKAANMADIVKRCPHHMGQGLKDGPSQECDLTPISQSPRIIDIEPQDTDPSANHVVTCLDPETRYETDSATGRHSLVLPYREPQAGNNSLQYLFTFKCFMSCVGGLNRRPIQLIFSLEHRGKIIGRQILNTRICACPGRDRKSDERNKGGSKKKGTKRTKQVSQTVSFTSLKKKQKTEPKDREVFNIRVEGRWKYEALLKIKEGLDLMDVATADQWQAIKDRDQQLEKLMQLTSKRNK